MMESYILSIEQEIVAQKVLEGEKQKPFQALENPVNAQSHTSIYKMHRYYARRPWNVFQHILSSRIIRKQAILCLIPFVVAVSLWWKERVIANI